MTSMSNNGRLPYPNSAMRVLLRLPIWLYRMGLADVVSIMPLMILTTRGRKSGLPRRAVIEYRRHGRKIYAISAWGKRPQWVQNLADDPCVTLQQGRRNIAARAKLVDDASEALRVLYLFRRTSPVVYDAVLAWLADGQVIDARTLPDVSDQFTIIRFDPVEDPPLLPVVEADLAWIGPVSVLAAILLTVFLVINRTRRSS
jgi:deazaflavin-dependent oxidoreductase (nitroreductase family)